MNNQNKTAGETAIYPIFGETEKAIKISGELYTSEKNVPVWLPKSQIKVEPYDADPKCRVITIPNWLIDAKIRELNEKYRQDCGLNSFTVSN
jgi:hypothetical protein